MKIAFFSDCYLDLTGGIVTSINTQKTALEHLGHTVYIFSTSYQKSKKTKQQLAKNHIFPVPSCRFFFHGLTPVSRRPKIIENWLLQNHPELKNFDIFYIHYESGCSVAGLRLGKKLGIPTVQVMHGREDIGLNCQVPFGFKTITATLLNWFHSWYLPHPIRIKRDQYLANSTAKAKMWSLMVNHASYADLVLTPSAHFREKLLHYGVKTPIQVFPNSFPDQFFPKSPSPKTLQQEESIKIIWHSRVSAEKRILPFLKALKITKAKYHLDIYGSGNDFRRAKHYAKKHHLNTVFHGNTNLSQIYQKLQTSHLDVLVSYNYDTFGMTLIEAEIFGVPAFICDPDLQEIIPKDSYIISSSPSPESMAQALNHLSTHPEKIAQMSKIMLAHREEILASHRIKFLVKLFNGIIKI